MTQHIHSFRIKFLLLLLLTTVFTTPAQAWWEKGHRIVTSNAVAVLPRDMPAFFKSGRAALIRLSEQPDMWKNFGTELRRAESPDHYIDIEKLTDDPMKIGFYEDRYAALQAIYTMNETPVSVGMLSYRLVEEFQKLAGAFAQYRQNPENTSIQQEILVYAGLLGHYAGDTAQPLHMTIHFDGRVDREGKVIKGKGIHARFEGGFVEKFIESSSCRPYVESPVGYENLYHAIREAFTVSFKEIDRVYQLDETGQLNAPDSTTKTFVQKRLAHGSSFLASLWYTAWKTSADIKLSR